MLDIYTIDELLQELERRCSALIVGVQYHASVEGPETTLRVSGNFAHCEGLHDVLGIKIRELTIARMYPDS